MLKNITAFGVLLCAGMASAHAVTIDFEAAVPGTAIVVDQGFRISGNLGFGDEQRLGVTSDGGNQYFEAFEHVYEPMCACSASFASVILEREDGGAFAYYSADWSAYSENVSIDGLLGDGSYALDPVGTGDWLNVISVTYSATGPFCTSFCFADIAEIQVDNIVVGAAVPVPAAVWLFGSALAGLGWLRRSKRTG